MMADKEIIMRTIAQALIVFFMVVAFVPGAATGQKKDASDQEDPGVRARGLFIKRTSDAMRVKILDEGDEPVDPARVFVQGDKIKVELESNFEGYLYIINSEPNGRKCLLFPYARQRDNRVEPKKIQKYPAGEDVIAFNEEKGIEVLRVIMSRKPIEFLDSLLKNSNCDDPEKCCELSGEASGQMAKVNDQTEDQGRGGLAESNIEQVLPKEKREGVRSRDIIFGAGRDKREGSFVAVSGEKGKGGKLQSGQVAVFEIRLKHN